MTQEANRFTQRARTVRFERRNVEERKRAEEALFRVAVVAAMAMSGSSAASVTARKKKKKNGKTRSWIATMRLNINKKQVARNSA